MKLYILLERQCSNLIEPDRSYPLTIAFTEENQHKFEERLKTYQKKANSIYTAVAVKCKQLHGLL